MSRTTLKLIAASLLGLFVAGSVALASGIKNWSSGETIRSADLNSNFNHIHNTMVGGHGARLTDSDVSSTAAIQHSKMQYPALLPKAWVRTNGACAAGGGAPVVCTLDSSSRVQAVVGVDSVLGFYRVYLSYQPANANFMVQATPHGSANGTCRVISTAVGTDYAVGGKGATAQVNVQCVDLAAGVQNLEFGVVVFDDSNETSW